MKSIVLCADDYGQAEAISNGILKLVQKNRLSAVSCMVNTPNWHASADKLIPYQDQINIGLHFNLTHGTPLSSAFVKQYGKRFSSLPVLMRNALIHHLKEEVILSECLAQIKAFQAKMGFLPHFIDGHQHIQHFPVIRKALIRAYKKTYPKKNSAYIRLVDIQLRFSDILCRPKKIIICMMGVYQFQSLLEREGIPFNVSFSGVYDFKKSTQYPKYFKQFLAESKHGGLIMCHPGVRSSDRSDVIRESRLNEFSYLASDAFLADCKAAGFRLAAFRQS